MLLQEFRLKPHVRLDGHAHSSIHLCVVREGGFAERRGSGWEDCGAGSIRVSPAAAVHDLQIDGQGACVQILELPGRITAGLAQPLRRSVFFHGVSATVVRLDRAGAAADSFALECLALELAARAVASDPACHAPEWLLALRRELDTEPLGTRGLAELAARHGRDRSHVARSFRAWFGRSIGAHVRARRLLEAARRLRSTDVPIAALAHELGFTDQAHFTRAFAARYTHPPARFRATSRAGATSVQDPDAATRQNR